MNFQYILQDEEKNKRIRRIYYALFSKWYFKASNNLQLTLYINIY